MLVTLIKSRSMVWRSRKHQHLLMIVNRREPTLRETAFGPGLLDGSLAALALFVLCTALPKKVVAVSEIPLGVLVESVAFC